MRDGIKQKSVVAQESDETKVGEREERQVYGRDGGAVTGTSALQGTGGRAWMQGDNDEQGIGRRVGLETIKRKHIAVRGPGRRECMRVYKCGWTDG